MNKINTRRSAAPIIFGAVIVVAGFFIAWVATHRVDTTGAEPDAISGSSQGKAKDSGVNNSVESSITKYLSSRQGPIELYGHVADQNGNPVDAATVKVTIRSWDGEAPAGILSFQTDKNGQFTIKGLEGDGLTIQEIIKEGYVGFDSPAGAPRTIAFGVKQKYVPDPNKPLSYRIWRRNDNLQPLLRIDHTWDAISDGRTCTIDLLTKQLVEGESSGGDFRVSITRQLNKENRSGNTKYKWNATIEAVDGGLIDVGDVHYALWEAPSDGYQTRLTWSHSVDDTEWTDDIETKVYLRSRGGQVYASGRIRIRATYGGVGPAIGFDGILNPHGSQNLEPYGGNLYSDYELLQQNDPHSPKFRPRMVIPAAKEGHTKQTVESTHDTVLTAPRSEDLFGLVLDQDENPVSGVAVQISEEKSRAVSSPRVHDVITDSDGHFVVKDIPYGYLEINSVSKSNYIVEPYLDRSIGWGGRRSDGRGISNQNPLIIRTWRRHGPLPLLSGRTQNISVLADGSKHEIDLVDKKTDHEIKATLLLGIKRPEDPMLGEWMILLSLKGGGLLENNDLLPFMAPEGGYRDEYVYLKPPELRGYKRFYFHNPEGPVYGYLNFQVIEAYSPFSESDVLVRVESFVNLENSRSLERK